MNPASFSVENGIRTYKLYIDGQWTETQSGSIADSLNPATGEIFARVHQGSEADMLKAVASAHSATAKWCNSLVSEREIMLLKVCEIVARRRTEIREMLIDETGSVYRKADKEIDYVVDLLRSAAGDVRHVMGETMPMTKPGQLSMSIRRPLGVVAGIAPFNSPFVLSMKKLVLALAAGNTFILKPSEETPINGIMIADLFDEAGLPTGVLNVVPGTPREIGSVLTSDPRIKLLTFTGSTRTGKALAVECAKNLKKFNLEMGGKSPLIILADADLDYAVKAAVDGVFYHQGQQCMAGSRVFVEEPIFKAFCDAFVEKTRSLVMGDPRNENTYIGPLIKAAQCDFIGAQIADAVKAGASVLIGGKFRERFFEPTVLSGVTPSMRIYREESFGPVVSLIPVKDAETALLMANDTDYGLSAGIITNDLQGAWHLALELDVGMVHINGNTFADEPHVPFGGVKDSGFGREGGKSSWEELTELKWVTLQMGQRAFAI